MPLTVPVEYEGRIAIAGWVRILIFEADIKRSSPIGEHLCVATAADAIRLKPLKSKVI
jgi:hypothetical protein